MEASPVAAARYQGWVGDSHYHLVCRRCGAVADVACPAGPAPCLEPAARLGYAIDEAEVTFWGLCADCRPARAESPFSP
jgi:Fur family transcriptional regulator, stress-responsive regulator